MKCEIRKWNPSDKYELAEILNNRNMQENLGDGLPDPYTPDDAEWYINEMLNADPNANIGFAIALDGRVIGSITVFRRQNDPAGAWEIGYYIGEPHWGHGYMTEAVHQICKFAFTNTDITRISAEVFARNIGSCRVLEKCGFRYEGTLRAHAVKNGERLDVKNYILTKKER